MKNEMFKPLLSLILILFAGSGIIKLLTNDNREPVFLKDDNTAWADSVFKSLTPEERIGQLFMISGRLDKTSANDSIKHYIQRYKPGGIIIFKQDPYEQAVILNQWQAMSKTPMLVSIDGEWGLSMRIDSTTVFPRQMSLGALQNDSLVYQMGAEIARQCARTGIHINFAPVVDVNYNPKNPVINSRSFGEGVDNVISKGIAYMNGMQDNHVLAVAKHFPGHGDTNKDSHHTLPVISHNRDRLDSIELKPFRALIKEGVGGIMTAHLHIPALDSAKNSVSSLSSKITNDLLKEELGYKGLIFSDALIMKGVLNHYSIGESAVLAIKAGNDIVLTPEDVNLAFSAIKKAVEAGEIDQKTIDERCKKVLRVKKWAGLDAYKPINLHNLTKELNNSIAESINRKLVELSTTLLQNRDSILPLKGLDKLKIAAVSIDAPKDNPHLNMLQNYAHVSTFAISKKAGTGVYNNLLTKLKAYDLVIVTVHSNDRRPSRNFGITKSTPAFVDKLSRSTKVVLNLLANPYGLDLFTNQERLHAILIGYENTDHAQSVTAQAIFGGVALSGTLPVGTARFPKGNGIGTRKVRLSYAENGFAWPRPELFNQIDSLVAEAIADGVFPGCQVYLAQKGSVLYNKSFGHHTYDKKIVVENNHLYDLASLTKISATLPSLMALSDDSALQITHPMSEYWPPLQGTNKEGVIIQDVLSHHSQLQKWIPFYAETISKNGKYKGGIYSNVESEKYSCQVANKLYMNKSYRDVIFQTIFDSPMREVMKYRYSDLGFIMFKELIEHQTHVPMQDFVHQRFYAPLGATTLVYLPLEHFDKKRIAPSENDNYFRHQVIQGYVHDYAAAMLGGVSGHAGLFGSANDLGKLMQVYLNGGTYGGQHFFADTTVAHFSQTQLYKNQGNRRALGFDKPFEDGYSFNGISEKSFGHTGFTGTMVWIDPDTGIVFIFLSNRTFPSQKNGKIVKTNFRPKLQKLIYEALGKAPKDAEKS